MPPRYKLIVLALLVGALSCIETIAPIRDSASTCSVDRDCQDTFFCRESRCLRSSVPRCGDGRIDEDEQCDDGNRLETDACVACRNARCGDGALQLGVEGCDEGDGINADDQANRCRLDCRPARCGDGTIDSDEECDDGTANSVGIADRCRIDCTTPRCGDGVVDSGEECDDANSSQTDACSALCEHAHCGDGIVRTDLQEGEPGFEYCDDANSDDEDDCDRYCGQGILAAASGSRSSCVAKHNGSVWCWGEINRQERAHWSLRPIRIRVPGRMVELRSASSRSDFLGRTDDGTVFTWNSEAPHQVNLGGRSAVRLPDARYRLSDQARRVFYWNYICTEEGSILRAFTAPRSFTWPSDPTIIEGPSEGMIDCAVSEKHTEGQLAAFVTYCGLTPQRQLYCWGDNLYGLTGNGTQEPVIEPYRLPLSTVRSFAVGWHNACALDAENELHCWGRIEEGAVTVPMRIQSVPKLARLAPAWRLDNGAWITSITFNAQGIGTLGETAGILRPRHYKSGFVIDETFRLWSQGDDYMGKTGVGQPWRYRPVRVAGLEPASSLALGTNHACARRAEDGQVHCWGGTLYHVHTSRVRGMAQGVRNGDPPTWVGESLALDSGQLDSCLIAPEHHLHCWGNGRFYPPQQIRLHDEWSPDQISVGGNHQCVLEAGSAYCWGDNSHGQTGQGDVPGDNTPRLVVGLPSLAALSLGDQHGCALSETGTVWCWGDNQFGQLGRAHTEVGFVPHQVQLPFPVVQLSAGANHNCVRAQAGTVHCWGGEGNPTGHPEELDINFEVRQPRNDTFAAVPGISDAQWISSGDDYACAVERTSSEVLCWAGEPSLVTGSRFFEGPEPRVIPGLPPIERVETGPSYACALSATGETWCWGLNTTNQLGDDYLGEAIRDWTPVDRFDQELGDLE